MHKSSKVVNENPKVADKCDHLFNLCANGHVRCLNCCRAFVVHCSEVPTMAPQELLASIMGLVADDGSLGPVGEYAALEAINQYTMSMYPSAAPAAPRTAEGAWEEWIKKNPFGGTRQVGREWFVKFAEHYAASETARADRAERSWRCFHCEFTTTDRAEAEAHFGEDGAVQAVCKLWTELSQEDRLKEYLSISQQLNAERDESGKLLERAETAERDLRSSNQHAQELNAALAEARKALQAISEQDPHSDALCGVGTQKCKMDCIGCKARAALTPNPSTPKETT